MQNILQKTLDFADCGILLKHVTLLLSYYLSYSYYYKISEFHLNKTQ